VATAGASRERLDWELLALKAHILFCIGMLILIKVSD
jgi:hypothetical protein